MSVGQLDRKTEVTASVGMIVGMLQLCTIAALFWFQHIFVSSACLGIIAVVVLY